MIQKEVIEITLPSKEEASAIQNEVSNACHQKVSSILENVMNRYSLPETTIQIDRLSLELGEVNASRLKQDFEEKITRQFEEKLSSTIATTSQGPVEGVNVVPEHSSEIDQVMYFLRTGVFNWSTGSQVDLEETVQRLLASSAGDFWEAFKLEIQQGNNSFTERAIHQFSDTTLFNILRNCDSGVRSELEESVKTLREFLANTQSGIHTRVGRMATWRAAFLESLRKNRVKKTEADFMESFISQLKTSDGRPAVKLEAELKKFLEKRGSSPRIPERIDLGKFHKDKRNQGEQSSAKKSAEQSVQLPDRIYVSNAGVVLLHPFLGTLFTGLGLMDDDAFIDLEATYKAIHLIHFMANENEKPSEHELAINKLLCGLDIETPIPKELRLSRTEREECEHLLVMVIQRWKALKKTSVSSLRSAFLSREGILIKEAGGWRILIEPKAYDVLLDKIPWPRSIIKLPWVNKIIHVEW